MTILWSFAALAVFTTLSAATPAWAEVDLAAVDSCVNARIEAGDAPADCIDNAHAECLVVPDATAAVATLCYVEARDRWTSGIAALLEEVSARAPDEIAAVGRIEVKYDILGGLIQCDRMEELALAASSQPEETILRQKTRCAATASGLAYVRLRWRMKALQ